MRSSEHPWGLPDELLPPSIKGTTGPIYVEQHNALVVGALMVIAAAARAGLEFWVEQPADDGPALLPDGTPNRFHHRRGARSAHLFRLQAFQEIVSDLGGAYVCGIQCPFGALSPKHTIFFVTRGFATHFEPFATAVCVCLQHIRLRGRNRRGEALTKIAQSYPGPLNTHIAVAMDSYVEFPASPVMRSFFSTGMKSVSMFSEYSMKHSFRRDMFLSMKAMVG